MNFYLRHIGDYLKDTAHLSLLEHGVYARLLDVYYTREGPIPEAQAGRLIGARSRDELAAMRSVLTEFFVLTEAGAWQQARCEREVGAYQRKCERNREVGKLGGRPRKAETQKEPTGLSVGSETVTHDEPTPNPRITLSSNQYPVTSNKPPTLTGRPPLQGKPEPKPKAAAKRPMPADFAISPRVRAWAAAGGFAQLDQHLDAFRRKCAANGYRYVDWDAALMEAIREDWAKLRGRLPAGQAPPAEGAVADWRSTRGGVVDRGCQLGVGPFDEVAAHVGSGPAWQEYRSAVIDADARQQGHQARAAA